MLVCQPLCSDDDDCDGDGSSGGGGGGGDDDDDDDDDVVTEVDLSAVRAESRLNNSAALHRRAVRPQRQRPLTQYQPYTHTNVNHSFQVLRNLLLTYLPTCVAGCHMVW